MNTSEKAVVKSARKRGMKRIPVSRMSIGMIQRLVEDDFGRRINQTTAQQIKEASAGGALVWTARHLVTTDKSRLRIAPLEVWNPNEGSRY